MLLLDTNVVSELRHGRRGDRNVNRWFDNQDAQQLFISVMTLFEIEKGIGLLARRDTTQSDTLGRWYQEHVLKAFTSRTLSVSKEIAQICATLHNPNPRPLADSLIAATAIARGFTLITRNEADFAEMPVRVINPWRL